MADSNFDAPLLKAMLEKRVQAEVTDVDYYRIGGGLAVETDYIIRVSPTKGPYRGPQFESFVLSKTFSAFRTFGQQLKSSATAHVIAKEKTLSRSERKLVQYCETVIHLVETQRVSYLGKVNYSYVKGLAKKRSLLIDQVLVATLNFFPDSLYSDFHAEIAYTIQTFFLLDHCIEEPDCPPTPEISPSVDSKTLENTGNRCLLNSYPSANTVNEGQPFLGVDFDSAIGNVIAVGDFLRNSIRGKASSCYGSTRVTITSSNCNNNISPLRSSVVPYTRKSRRSLVVREKDVRELKQVGCEATLLVDDDRAPIELVPSYSHPMSNYSSPGGKIGDLLETNPFVFLLIGAIATHMVRQATRLTVTMDLDILMLLTWAAFCIGLHTPRPLVSGVDKSNNPTSTQQIRPKSWRGLDRSGSTLLRMSMISTPDKPSHPSLTSDRIQSIRDEEIESAEMLKSKQLPLPKFPDDAELGSQLNSWSLPVHDLFQIRGKNYLADRKKIPSAPFLFPIRAADLFLTDACPQHAGSNPRIMGGELRKVPTFLLNFRLPWGVLLAYFEIPDRFVPFVSAGHDPDFDKSTLPSLNKFSSSDRCVARFLQGPIKHKNATLKIVPYVVEGPWVVKSVVGGKPAIIGNKMPVSYYYQRAEGGKKCYLEADFDIVASSAARGILSCVRSYTQVLTLDLGFVVQGNSEDELPEQMLVGVRLHGIDPLTAPPYPSPNELFSTPDDEEDNDSGIYLP